MPYADLEQRREYQREYQRAYYHTPKMKRWSKAYRRSPEVMAAARERAARMRNNHPERHAARNAVNNAIRDGRLVRMPCEVCGREDSQAHHDDYAKPLEVRWLCRPHHEDVHRGKEV